MLNFTRNRSDAAWRVNIGLNSVCYKPFKVQRLLHGTNISVLIRDNLVIRKEYATTSNIYLQPTRSAWLMNFDCVNYI